MQNTTSIRVEALAQGAGFWALRLSPDVPQSFTLLSHGASWPFAAYTTVAEPCDPCDVHCSPRATSNMGERNLQDF